MGKRIIAIVLLAVMLFAIPAGAVPVAQIDGQSAAQGLVQVAYNAPAQERLRVVVEKVSRGSDSPRYVYELQPQRVESFPLQLGNGAYQVTIAQQVEGNRYRPVARETVQVNLQDPLAVYRQSVQLVSWDEQSAAVAKARELVRGVASDREKLERIYNYVVANIAYDYGKIEGLPSTYLPAPDATFSQGQGICYDFAALMGAMLRSVGVPTKLVKGYADRVEGYHAWNEVFVDGRWLVVDTSYDSQLRELGRAYSLMKPAGEYHKVYEY